MRMYDIALFLFIFNYILGFISAELVPLGSDADIQPLDSQYTTTGFDSRAEDTINKVNQLNDGGVMAEINWLVENVRLTITALPSVITAFADATVFLPFMLNHIGVTGEIVVIVTAIVWFVYFVGIFQLVTGRNIRGAQ